MGFPWYSETMDWEIIGDSFSKFFGEKEEVCTVVIDKEVVAFTYEEMSLK